MWRLWFASAFECTAGPLLNAGSAPLLGHRRVIEEERAQEEETAAAATVSGSGGQDG